eukprot:4022350-Pleurochrysis_carterae.AAC.1
MSSLSLLFQSVAFVRERVRTGCFCSPDGGRRGVPLGVEDCARGLQVLGREAQVLLDAVEHGAAAGVDAEKVKGRLEGGDVGDALVVQPREHQPIHYLRPHRDREQD